MSEINDTEYQDNFQISMGILLLNSENKSKMFGIKSLIFPPGNHSLGES